MCRFEAVEGSRGVLLLLGCIPGVAKQSCGVLIAICPFTMAGKVHATNVVHAICCSYHLILDPAPGTLVLCTKPW